MASLGPFVVFVVLIDVSHHPLPPRLPPPYSFLSCLCSGSALDGDGFGATFSKRGVALEFIKGMKVEAVDRSFKDIITVATIKEIDGDKVLP